MKHLEVIQNTVNNIYWMLVLQGVFFIALAVLLLLYPPLLVALVAAAFVIFGALLLMGAWKINRLWRNVPGFLKK
jgi:uncharacterized membrane protein HdeD (DUF308 family)